MNSFRFHGTIPPSKSIINRWQIIQSFQNPSSSVPCFNTAEIAKDVYELQSALQAFAQGHQHLYAGAGGTSFRFLVLRTSRRPGTYQITGTSRLLKRPQQELLRLLAQLGVRAELNSDDLRLTTRGWQWHAPIVVSAQTSSQFATAILLSAWGLHQELVLQVESPIVSQGYLNLTLDFLMTAGMRLDFDSFPGSQGQGLEIRVPPFQRLRTTELVLESDVSSAFAIACCAAVAGEAVFENFPSQSRQPDLYGFELLRQMGASIVIDRHVLTVRQVSQKLQPISADLTSCPDLLPALGVLCSQSQGTSTITGINHAQAKESDRVSKTLELLNSLKVPVTWDGNTLKIVGAVDLRKSHNFVFNPDEDHRMAMAAQVARWAGASIEIMSPDVVAKSFPQFWDITHRHEVHL